MWGRTSPVTLLECFLLVVCFAAVCACPQQPRRVSVPAAIPLLPGATASVPVILDFGQGIYTCRMALRWDRAQLAYVRGSAQPRCSAAFVNDATAGSLILSMACTTELPAEPVTLATFVFLAAANAACGTTHLVLDPALTRLNDGQVPVQVRDGVFLIACPPTPFPTDAPLPTHTPAAVPTARYPAFDVNEDGIIDHLDFLHFTRDWHRLVP